MGKCHRILGFVCLALWSAACSDPVDKAAKARIFSPEDPPRAVSSAAERLPPEEVASDARVTRRVLGMGAAEATERLGPHRFTATVSFEWTAGDRAVKLDETRTLRAGPGGVSGDFHAVIENARSGGLEVIRAGGQVYARNRFGKFRHRKRDRGVAERERDEVFGAIRDFDRLFQGRLALKPVGTLTVGGRTAWRYDVSLAAAPQATTDDVLPPIQFAKGGTDADTGRRLRFFDKREPVALHGQVLVDAETSVVLKSRLEGQMKAPGEAGAADVAHLRLVVTSEVTEIGKAQEISAPKDFLPDADKPQGIADALNQFGIERGGDEEGEAVPAAEEVPEEEG